MMEIRLIQNEADCGAALDRINNLMGAEPGTAAGEELELLSLLVERYEQQHYLIEAPDPIEYLKNVIEFRGAGQNDLARVLKSRSRASEILNRRRPLTLQQIRRITDAWQIPADPLIREYELIATG